MSHQFTALAAYRQTSQALPSSNSDHAIQSVVAYPRAVKVMA